MMNDDNRFGSSPMPRDVATPSEAGLQPPATQEPAIEQAGDQQHAPAPDSPEAAPASTTPEPDSTAILKFKSCRWRCDPEDGEFCTHRDVLPYAGKEGFNPDSWCPECAYYKLRRTPKKRERMDYTY
jgi:hypothetical protein